MSNETIKRLKLSEKDQIVDFLNQHWGTKHPLVNNETLFNYYYTDGEWRNFYCLCDDDGIAAVCGYIKCSDDAESDIWISIWCAKKGKNGLGLALMGKMQELTGAKVMGCNNIRRNTMPFYTFLGYHPDEMKHYYRLCNLDSYKMAVVNSKNILSCDEPKTELAEFFNIDDVKNNFDNFGSCTPKKDYWYVNKRYFDYPHYEYRVFGIFKNSICSSLVVFRINESDEGKVLRLVDYIGSPADFADINGHIDILMEKYDCEFCDCYCFGVNGEDAGFVLRTADDTNIIPNYLNPLLQENIDYCFFTSSTDKFVMFKADGDQDRINLG